MGRWNSVHKKTMIEAGNTKPPFELGATFPDGSVRILKVIKIVLTIAHLNHAPEDCRDENLKALCQRHNLLLDGPLHRKNAARTRRAKLNNLELFPELA